MGDEGDYSAEWNLFSFRISASAAAERTEVEKQNEANGARPAARPCRVNESLRDGESGLEVRRESGRGEATARRGAATSRKVTSGNRWRWRRRAGGGGADGERRKPRRSIRNATRRDAARCDATLIPSENKNKMSCTRRKVKNTGEEKERIYR